MAKNPLSKQIGRQEWLDRVAEVLQDVVRRAYGSGGPNGRKVKNALHGTWLGHPLHVILTDIPLGGWTTALLFDLMEVTTRRREFGKAADAAVTIGLLGALGAAVTGLTDFQDVDSPASRIGAVHGLVNVTAASLFVASLVKRKKGARSAGRNLALLGFMTGISAAYLGGSLVYDEGIGVDHTLGQKFPKEFTAVLPESELDREQLKRVERQGVPILLARGVGGEICAVAETCTHLGGPLSEGTREGDTVQCPWHGSRFSLQDGRVLDGPAVHPLPCLETRIRDGQIEIRLRRDEASAQETSGATVPRPGAA
jgi:nitrite reductase/ring-hydroxylating ferredoxin subunit/uncharacterized membrane protein